MSTTPSNRAHAGHRATHAPAPTFRLGRLVFVVVLMLAAGFAFGLVPRLIQRRHNAAESAQLAVSTVVAVQPMPGKAGDQLVLSGELKPMNDASIYARANGYVRRWLVDIGAKVEAGQLLAELDTPEIDRELAAARAELRQAQAAQNLAAATNKRWAQMLQAKTVSAQEAEERSGDFSVKQAAVEAAAANVERLTELTGFSKVTAPFAGTVTVRNIDVGQLVNSGGGRELFHISQIEKLRVFVRVPQSYAKVVTPGQKAQLTVPEIPGRVFEGTVVRSAGAIDAASRTLLTELEVDNSNGELFAGSFARVKLAESQTEAPLTVPANTLLFRAQGPQIGVIDASNHVELRNVELGRDFGARIELLSGVSANERIVLNPPDSLVTGVEVRVASAESVSPGANTGLPAAHK